VQIIGFAMAMSFVARVSPDPTRVDAEPERQLSAVGIRPVLNALGVPPPHVRVPIEIATGMRQLNVAVETVTILTLQLVPAIVRFGMLRTVMKIAI